MCYEDEGVYVNTYGRITKDVVLQWGEMPTSVGTSHRRLGAFVKVVSFSKTASISHTNFAFSGVVGNGIVDHGNRIIIDLF